jgi:hypothetical protein
LQVADAQSIVFPLRIRRGAESYVVEDACGVALAYFYFEDEPTRRRLVKRLTSDEAKTVVQTIARALTEAIKVRGAKRRTPRKRLGRFIPAPANGFQGSVFGTLGNIREQPQSHGQSGLGAGARGIVAVRGESIEARLSVVPGFWSARIVANVNMSASVAVDGEDGRLFGKTLEGHGRREADSGLCAPARKWR